MNSELLLHLHIKLATLVEYQDSSCAIVLEGGAKVKARVCFEGQRRVTVLAVDLTADGRTEDSHGMGLEVVSMTVNAVICGDGGVKTIRASAVHSDEDLLSALVPVRQRELRIGLCECR